MVISLWVPDVCLCVYVCACISLRSWVFCFRLLSGFQVGGAYRHAAFNQIRARMSDGVFDCLCEEACEDGALNGGISDGVDKCNISHMWR